MRPGPSVKFAYVYHFSADDGLGTISLVHQPISTRTWFGTRNFLKNKKRTCNSHGAASRILNRLTSPFACSA